MDSEAMQDAVSETAESSGETKDAKSEETKSDDGGATNMEFGGNQETIAAAEEAKDAPENDGTSEKEDEKTSAASVDQSEDAKDTVTANETKSKASTNGNQKVKVHFVAVGSAPIMKKTKFQIGAEQRFAAVTTFLRKMLKLSGSGSSLFLYCNSAFVPAPDELVGDLNDCFSIRGELVIHYSIQEAWG